MTSPPDSIEGTIILIVRWVKLGVVIRGRRDQILPGPESLKASLVWQRKLCRDGGSLAGLGFGLLSQLIRDRNFSC